MQKNKKPNQCIYTFVVPNYTLFTKINAKKKKNQINASMHLWSQISHYLSKLRKKIKNQINASMHLWSLINASMHFWSPINH